MIQTGILKMQSKGQGSHTVLNFKFTDFSRSFQADTLNNLKDPDIVCLVKHIIAT